MQNDLFNPRDLFAYFIVAGIGFLIQLLAGSILQDWFALSYQQALFIGYGVAFVSGFFLTKLFAFNTQNTTQSRRQVVKFSLVAIISCLITVYGASTLFQLSVDILGDLKRKIPYSHKLIDINKLGSQIVAMGASFISNYILHKRFTFADTGFYDRLKQLLRL
ncbi:GtrA family protein [Dyadobacter sp. LJ53]|uniref:GtrA family protein n=1 Tax=Dyadobacter chenwenxiniae TaxID=2906456 RepID=UPI001F3988B2|nr:GtrA family protein [Dyadobacter chenwenxiniae]MCF0051011.1 GtrA family protein [Dyadobacter chenwenxiniae]